MRGCSQRFFCDVVHELRSVWLLAAQEKRCSCHSSTSVGFLARLLNKTHYMLCFQATFFTWHVLGHALQSTAAVALSLVKPFGKLLCMLP